LRPILRATGFGGLELPVIDVTHPAFAPPAPADVERLTEDLLRDQRSRRWMPRFLQRAVVGFFLRRSVIGSGLLEARGSYLRALPTYLLKVGEANLGPWATPIDRKIAATLPAAALQLRLHDMAALLAEGIARTLGARPGQPLQLLNVAGGVAADSLNALILLRRDRPGLLEGRSIVLSVLDAESEAPAFGRAALHSLAAEGAPLHGLAVEHEHVRYDWREPGALAGLVRGGSVVACSSEGGLFDYGEDADVVANLRAVREAAPPDTPFVGSVTPDDRVAAIVNAGSSAALRPRSLAAFTALAARAGWRADAVVERPLSRDVRLVRAT
jgi:hypothetical protein